MNISEVCVRRPVFSTVLSLVIVVLGLVTWSQLPLRQYPLVEQPIVSITTTYSGASPEIMESQISRPLENAFAGIEGVDFIESSSESETSKVNVYFKNDRNIDSAANDVRDRIGRLQLPPESDRPTILKADADGQAIIYLALSSPTSSVSQLQDYADRFLRYPLESLSGVAKVDVTGGGNYQMQLLLDTIRLAAHGVTAADVHATLKKQNLERPAGRLESDDKEFLMTTKARMSTPEEYNEMIILEKNGHFVRLKDVGYAKLVAEEKRVRTRFNGQSTVGLAIYKQSVANPVEISKQLQERLVDIRKNLPTDMTIGMAYDRTVYIQHSIEAVYHTLWEAILLVVFVIFIFLGSFRASLVPLVTIPVSLIGSFVLIYLFGFSVNTLTLLAMVLAIGLVVDDAIIVLENIHRHIEMGKKPIQASIDGVKEISFAVIAMTLTLAAVYAPISLSSGMTGKLFTEFALTLAGAVLISGFVALTLSPMMCSKLLQRHQSKLSKFLENIHQNIELAYARSLYSALKLRRLTVAGGAAVALAGVLLSQTLPSELVPEEDQGAIFLQAFSPIGATMQFIDRYVVTSETIIRRVPEVDSLYTTTILPSVMGRISLKPWHERNRSVSEITTELRKDLSAIPGLNVSVSAPKSLMGGGDGSSVRFVIQTNRTFGELKDVKDKFLQILLKQNKIVNLYDNLNMDGQDYFVDIDRNRAASIGVDVETISSTIDLLVSGRRASKFKRDGKEYDVIISLEDRNRRNPQDINDIFVRSEKSGNPMISLEDLVTIKSRPAAIQLSHFNQMRAVTMSGDLKPNVSMGELIKDIETIGEQVLPKGMKVDFTGETRRFIQESRSIVMIFGLALAFIFMVLAAQFESFVDPFIIMFSVPLSITGGLFALWLTNGTLNLYSQIGLVTLIGLITKHGILLVEFANKRREEGDDPFSAILEACRLRLRPILMTTFAMVLGSVPLALATGAGAESRQQIGWVIVGGMTLGTLFTLYVVPCVYTWLTRGRKVEEDAPHPSTSA